VPFWHVSALGHALLHVPQCPFVVRRFVSQPSPKLELQSPKLGLHVAMVQSPAEQPAVATLVAEHAVHDEVPQELGLVLSEHDVPQRWNPEEQLLEQLFDWHSALPPPPGAGHARHAAPLVPVPHSDADCALVTQPLASQHPFGHVVGPHAPHAPPEQMLPEPHGLPSLMLALGVQLGDDPAVQVIVPDWQALGLHAAPGVQPTQDPWYATKSVLHWIPQTPLHVALPFCGAGHVPQAAPPLPHALIDCEAGSTQPRDPQQPLGQVVASQALQDPLEQIMPFPQD
jgi:hypothetical protein